MSSSNITNDMTTKIMSEFIDNLKLNKIVMILIITSFLFILFMSLTSSISGIGMNNCYEYFKNGIEHLKNISVNNLYKYDNTYYPYTINYKIHHDTQPMYNNDVNLNYSNYKRLELLPPDDEFNSNSPMNLLFGTAEIYSKSNGNNIIVSCNLYVLSGNIYNSNAIESNLEPNNDVDYASFAEGNSPDKYAVLIVNSNNEEIYLGDLQKDGDGLYKLNTMTNENIKQLKIFFQSENGDEVLLLTTPI